MNSMSITRENKRTETISFFSVIAEIFSAVMEEQITPKQAKLLTNAIIAIILTVFTVGMPLWFNFLTFAWMIHALWLCKKNGLADEETDEGDF